MRAAAAATEGSCPRQSRVQEMVDNWQKSGVVRPEEAMTGWNEGMIRLQQLAERLNRQDEQRENT